MIFKPPIAIHKKEKEPLINVIFPSRKVIDDKRLEELKKFCSESHLSYSVFENPKELETKIIITIPYKREDLK